MRELDRLELLLGRIKAVEAQSSPAGQLMRRKGIGSELAASLWTEGLRRPFANRRKAGADPGLTPTPWRSGELEHEQGVSNTGN